MGEFRCSTQNGLGCPAPRPSAGAAGPVVGRLLQHSSRDWQEGPDRDCDTAIERHPRWCSMLRRHPAQGFVSATGGGRGGAGPTGTAGHRWLGQESAVRAAVRTAPSGGSRGPGRPRRAAAAQYAVLPDGVEVAAQEGDWADPLWGVDEVPRGPLRLDHERH